MAAWSSSGKPLDLPTDTATIWPSELMTNRTIVVPWWPCFIAFFGYAGGVLETSTMSCSPGRGANHAGYGGGGGGGGGGDGGKCTHVAAGADG